jgi:hypothetical protein
LFQGNRRIRAAFAESPLFTASFLEIVSNRNADDDRPENKQNKIDRFQHG